MASTDKVYSTNPITAESLFPTSGSNDMNDPKTNDETNNQETSQSNTNTNNAQILLPSNSITSLEEQTLMTSLQENKVNNHPSLEQQSPLSSTLASKSDSIARSYYHRSSISKRFHNASLLAFRGSSSSRAANNATSTTADREGNYGNGINSDLGHAGLELSDMERQGGNHNRNHTTIKSNKNNDARTEVMESDGDDSSSSDIIPDCKNAITSTSMGSMLKDTYSFLYIYPACPPSAPFVYALFLFSFQGLVYSVLLSSLIDVNNPYNPLHVPPVVSGQMRIAQACAIFIAVVSSVDIMVAMNNLLRPPNAIVAIDDLDEVHGLLVPYFSRSGGNNSSSGVPLSPSPSSSTHYKTELSSRHEIPSSNTYGHRPTGPSFHVGLRYKVANVLRLIEGCLAVAASFILIVQSTGVIELFINFAALEFVVNLDNLAFALAEHGLVSDRLQDSARFIGRLGYVYCDFDNSPRTKKRRNVVVASCTSTANLERAGRLSQLKGNAISRLFQSPAKVMRNHPDITRRITLILMLVTLSVSWGVIISQQSNGDFLCKSVNVEFFHAHILSSLDVDGDLKPFLSSRSGTYVAMFDHNQSFFKWLINLGSHTQKQVLAYRKANSKIQPPLLGISDIPLLAPPNYADVAFYDSRIKSWVFATCDPDSNLLRERASSCVGPEVHSVDTPIVDLVMLSSSAFHLAGGSPAVASTFLPASISCNECSSRANDDYQFMGSVNPMACSLSGGECSDPQEEFGWSRNCVCPRGQFGAFCDEHYEASCSVIKFVHDESLDGPPGAAHFQPFELGEFHLLPYERGLGNSPIWERKIGGKGFTDRIERRGGTHWTITRHSTSIYTDVESLKTIGIADDAFATDGAAPGLAGMRGISINAQPPPAGLKWYTGKESVWGTQSDYHRPYSAYQLQCKPVQLA